MPVIDILETNSSKSLSQCYSIKGILDVSTKANLLCGKTGPFLVMPTHPLSDRIQPSFTILIFFCILMCNPHNHILLLFSLTSVFDMLPSFPIKLSSTHCRNAFSTFTKMKQRDTPSLDGHNSGIF